MTERRWQDKFLAILADNGGVVTDAAKAMGKARSVIYAEKTRDAEFRARWDEILEWTTEELEQIAYRRASESSDVLLIFLLKARRPNIYREGLKIEHGGAVTHEVEEKVSERIGNLLGEVDRLRERLAKVEPGVATGAPGEPRD